MRYEFSEGPPRWAGGRGAGAVVETEGPGLAQPGAEAGLGGTYREDGARLFAVMHGRRVRGKGHELKQEVHVGVRKSFTVKIGKQSCPQRLCSLGGLQDLTE